MAWKYEAYHVNSMTKGETWDSFVESQAKNGYELLGHNSEGVFFGKWKKEKWFEKKTPPLSIEEIEERYTDCDLPGVLVLKSERESGSDWVSKVMREMNEL